jgi:hypothetical protein
MFYRDTLEQTRLAPLRALSTPLSGTWPLRPLDTTV